MTHLKIRLFLMSLLIFILSGIARAADDTPALPMLPVPGADLLSGLPLAFVPGEKTFEARGMNGQMWFEPNVVTLALPDAEKINVVKIVYDSADTSPVNGIDPLPGKINHFHGSNPADWRTNISTYAALTVDDLYPGVDLRYDGAGGALKSTFIAEPGADWTQIRWRYDGAQNLRLDSGDLKITLPTGATLTEHAPIAWQEIDGATIPVDVAFHLSDDNAVSFDVGAYDPNHALILDPTLEYSTYIGGSGFDSAWSIDVDDSGYAYVVGSTVSSNFPISTGAYDSTLTGPSDAFVMKINTHISGAGSLVWSTYLGGNNGENATDVTLDTANNIYIVGTTSSNTFPVTDSAFQDTLSLSGGSDAYLVKLNPAGDTLLYASYLGGKAPEVGYAVAADDSGHAFIGGVTQSLPHADDFSGYFPVTPNAYDPIGAATTPMRLFIARFDTAESDAASLIYSTYLGGTNRTDSGMGMDADDEGSVYITGMTTDVDFPITPNAYQTELVYDDTTYFGNSMDAFITQLDTDVSGVAGLVYSTFLGGSRTENWDFHSGDISTNGDGIVYVTGGTESTDFPVVNGFQPTKGTNGPSSIYPPNYDAFVARINTNESGTAALEYSTYLGGTGFDFGYGIEATRDGNVYVTGMTTATNFPLRDAIQLTKLGSTTIFVAKLDTNAIGNNSLVYSTFLGRNSNAHGGIAVDANGTAYVTGDVTNSGTPITGGFQTTYGGATDGYLAKLSFRADLEVTKTIEPLEAVVGEPVTLTIEVHNIGPETATAVVLTEVIPDDVAEFVSAVAEQGSCTYATSLVTCQLGHIELDETVTVTMIGIPLPESVLPSPQGFATTAGTGEVTVIANTDGVERDDVSTNNTTEGTFGVSIFTDFVPTQSAPADNGSTPNPRVPFNSNAVPGAVSYEFQIGQTEPPTNTIEVISAGYTPPGDLIPGVYHWRVRALNAASQTTQWSETWTITITSGNSAVPQRNLFLSTSREATLTWNHITGFSDYDYEISTNSNLSTPILDDTINGLTVTVTLPDFGVYYWRVRGRDGAAVGTWSAIQSFTVGAP